MVAADLVPAALVRRLDNIARLRVDKLLLEPVAGVLDEICRNDTRSLDDAGNIAIGQETSESLR